MENYGDKVYRFLQNGEPGESWTIDRICEKENQPEFIALIKEFMALTPWQGGWQFTTDYKKLKRFNLNFNTAELNRGLYDLETN